MASAQVMAMPMDDAMGKERAAAAGTTDETQQQQDVYVKLKSLQKHMEFLDIQVKEGGGVRRAWEGEGGEGGGFSSCSSPCIEREEERSSGVWNSRPPSWVCVGSKFE